MKSLLEDFLEKYQDAPMTEYELPKYVCPDYIGYIGLCEEGFDITVQLCRDCWSQTIEK